ncbi:hypothetical protein MHU86_7095 [Fragilaria crotonensis]|nr:hypothetical protein MHU86_7095 [Fragilaria crotonensis]
MLSHGFLSQDPNLANPGGFTIFMFHPKTVSLGEKGSKGGNELLREYLGMEVDESTLAFYMKQGFYTPSNPNDLRIQLKTALDTLELLTCDGTIAGKGLAFILEPRRWARMSTILNDRFKSEKDFGAKFCYTLDRHLQTFFNKVTRWEDMASDGQPRYLVAKAEELLERLEDGQGLNIVLPVALSSVASTAHDGKRKLGATPATEKPGKKKKSGEASPAGGRYGPGRSTRELGSRRRLEAAIGNEVPRTIRCEDARSKRLAVLLDTRIPKKQNRSQKAPCVSGSRPLCKQGCSLAHITASRMTVEARAKVDLFKAVYTAST